MAHRLLGILRMLNTIWFSLANCVKYCLLNVVDILVHSWEFSLEFGYNFVPEFGLHFWFNSFPGSI